MGRFGFGHAGPLRHMGAKRPVCCGAIFTIAWLLGMLALPEGNVLNVAAGVAGTRMEQVVCPAVPGPAARISVLAGLILLPEPAIVPVAQMGLLNVA